jgi:hypothetical protein
MDAVMAYINHGAGQTGILAVDVRSLCVSRGSASFHLLLANDQRVHLVLVNDQKPYLRSSKASIS